MNTEIIEMLEKVKSGELNVEDASEKIENKMKEKPFDDLGFAKIDTHRKIRTGAAEVIFGEKKTSDQIIKIATEMKKNGEKSILITRLESEKAKKVNRKIKLDYFEDAKIAVIGEFMQILGTGKIVVACAGTSDLPVAEEAAVTAEFLGNPVVRLYDVGVAGLQRLLSNLDVLNEASVIIAVAGMEGALASVIGGLVSCPVIAVPTSIGYGANFGGLSALLSMLNSCSGGVSVVNIDNGFGAAMIASRINKTGC